MIRNPAAPARKGAPKPAAKGTSKPADKGAHAPAAKAQPKPRKAVATPAPEAPAPAITPASVLMAGTSDVELIEKTVHSLHFAAEDLRVLASTADNLLLGDIALRELEVAVGLATRMERVLSLLRSEDELDG